MEQGGPGLSPRRSLQPASGFVAATLNLTNSLHDNSPAARSRPGRRGFSPECMSTQPHKPVLNAHTPRELFMMLWKLCNNSRRPSLPAEQMGKFCFPSGDLIKDSCDVCCELLIGNGAGRSDIARPLNKVCKVGTFLLTHSHLSLLNCLGCALPHMHTGTLPSLQLRC